MEQATEKQLDFIKTLLQKEIDRWSPDNLREATNEQERIALAEIATNRTLVQRIVIPANFSKNDASDLITELKSGDFSARFGAGELPQLLSMLVEEEIDQDDIGLDNIASYMETTQKTAQPYLRRLDGRLVADFPGYRQDGHYIYTNRVIGDTAPLAALLSQHGYIQKDWGWQREFVNPADAHDAVLAEMINHTEETEDLYARLLEKTLALTESDKRRAALKSMATLSVGAKHA